MTWSRTMYSQKWNLLLYFSSLVLQYRKITCTLVYLPPTCQHHPSIQFFLLCFSLSQERQYIDVIAKAYCYYWLWRHPFIVLFIPVSARLGLKGWESWSPKERLGEEEADELKTWPGIELGTEEGPGITFNRSFSAFSRSTSSYRECTNQVIRMRQLTMW